MTKKVAEGTSPKDAKGRTLYLPGDPRLVAMYDKLANKYRVDPRFGKLDMEKVHAHLAKYGVKRHDVSGTGPELLTTLARFILWDKNGELNNVSEAATEAGLDNNKPIVVTGVKGMKSTSFRKKFRNMAAYNKWSDTDAAGDYEVHRIMNEGIRSKKKIREGVLDDMDDDGFMAKRQLYDIAKYAVELHRIIQDTDNLEPWIQAKITKAADYIDTVKHYLEYQDVAGADGQGAEIDFDIDDFETQVPTVEPEQDLMASADFEQEYEAMDILNWARMRGIISLKQFNDPEPVLYDLAANTASMLTPGDVEGSSDISILMRDFVTAAEAENILLMGPKVDAYYSITEAHRRYKKMLTPLRGKK
jgi:hypothetical protein